MARCALANCQDERAPGSDMCFRHAPTRKPTVIDRIIETAKALHSAGQLEFTSRDIVDRLPSVPRSSVTAEFSLAAAQAFTRVRREGNAYVYRLR